MKAVLVLNGEPPTVSRLQELASCYPVYAADGGAGICLASGIRPEWVAGDLDSLSKKSLPADWTLLEFPEQDRTDFQKLLGSLPEEITEVRILGGLGRRLDHLITNLLIACEISEQIDVVFEAEDSYLTRVTPARPFRQDLPIGTSLSLLPLQEVQGVKSSGLRWNLQDQKMGPGTQLGQSNEVEGPVDIHIALGNLFVWVAAI